MKSSIFIDDEAEKSGDDHDEEMEYDEQEMEEDRAFLDNTVLDVTPSLYQKANTSVSDADIIETLVCFYTFCMCSTLYNTKLIFKKKNEAERLNAQYGCEEIDFSDSSEETNTVRNGLSRLLRNELSDDDESDPAPPPASKKRKHVEEEEAEEADSEAEEARESDTSSSVQDDDSTELLCTIDPIPEFDFKQTGTEASQFIFTPTQNSQMKASDLSSSTPASSTSYIYSLLLDVENRKHLNGSLCDFQNFQTVGFTCFLCVTL